MPLRPYTPPPQEFGGEGSGSLDCPRRRESLAQPVPLRVRILPSTAKLYQPVSEGRLYRHFTDPMYGPEGLSVPAGQDPWGATFRPFAGATRGVEGQGDLLVGPPGWPGKRAPPGGGAKERV